MVTHAEYSSLEYQQNHNTCVMCGAKTKIHKIENKQYYDDVYQYTSTEYQADSMCEVCNEKY
jgi:hypothetical protein